MASPYSRAWAIESALRVKGSGTWRRGPCSACVYRVSKDDGKHKFNYNTRTGGFCCLRCGFKGKLRAYELEELGFALARQEESASTNDGPTILPPPEGYTPLYAEPGWSGVTFNQAHDYLARRGVSAPVMLDARIGACVEGKYRGRIIVPIIAPTSLNWYGFSSRAYYPNPRIPYLYPSGMDREEILYNHAALFVETDEPAIIVEGVFDALSVWPHGVAVLGTLSEPQYEALRASMRPVVLVPDGDAWEAGWALCMRLRFDGVRAGFIKLPPGVDPDEVPSAELYEQAQESINSPL